jgi:hypothetical protein
MTGKNTNTEPTDNLGWDESPAIDTRGGVVRTTVSISASGKPLGLDCYLKFEDVVEFSVPVDDDIAHYRRVDLAEKLTNQLAEELKASVEKLRTEIANTPKPAVNTTATPAASRLAPAVTPAPAGTGAQAVVAVANGATQTQGDWVSVASRFGDGQIRFISSRAYSSDQLKHDVAAWITSQGVDANLFDIWDERTGPRGAEAGNPIGSVFNIKVKKDYQSSVPADFHRNAAGRGRFKADGSIEPYWSKDFEAFLKFGGREKLAPAGF